MKTLGLAFVLFATILPAQSELFKPASEHAYKLFLETPEIVVAMHGEPIAQNIYYNDGAYREAWTKRKALYYLSADSMQVISYVFDYIVSYDALRAPLQQVIRPGDYVLISVTYLPVFLFDRVWRGLALKE